MQITPIIGISTETQTLFQIYKDGILIGTLNANDENDAKAQCAGKYNTQIIWQDLQVKKVLRS